MVIGAGQAGLATSHELSLAGIDHVVIERDRVGASWAGLWDSFRLNTPSWSTRLPGMAYGGDEPDGFMSKAEIVGYLERYRSSSSAPVTEGVDVVALERRDGGFELETSQGPKSARSVVVCSGAYQRAFRPPGAGDIPADLVTLDTRSYRTPEIIPDGAVLVVGSGQSGCQIAEELCDAGRKVFLSCGKAPWTPRRIGGHDTVWWALETGFMNGTADSLPHPAAKFAANITTSGVGGGHDLHLRSLRTKGVTLTGRFAAFEDGEIRFADDLADSVAWGDDRYREFRQRIQGLCAERGIAQPALPDPEPFEAQAPTSIEVSAIGSVIFSGGFRPDYSWVKVPDVVDPMGFPQQVDGASTVAPGLFFAGVHFLRTRKSSLLCGVGEDATVVAAGVAQHLAGAKPRPT